MFSSAIQRLNDRRDAEGDAGEDAGFTLIELMVVLLILAILLAIAIPTFLGVTKSANDRAAQSNLNTALVNAKAQYQNNSQTYPTIGQPGHRPDVRRARLTFQAAASTDQNHISRVRVGWTPTPWSWRPTPRRPATAGSWLTRRWLPQWRTPFAAAQTPTVAVDTTLTVAVLLRSTSRRRSLAPPTPRSRPLPRVTVLPVPPMHLHQRTVTPSRPSRPSDRDADLRVAGQTPAVRSQLTRVPPPPGGGTLYYRPESVSRRVRRSRRGRTGTMVKDGPVPLG